MTTQKEIAEDAAGGLGKRSKISPQDRSYYIVLASQVIAAAREYMALYHDPKAAGLDGVGVALAALDTEFPR